MSDLSVIIVTWNCKQYATDCLRSIVENPSRNTIDIVVVDNNSTDGTVDQIRKEYPAVRVITNSTNQGFAAANNQAIRATSSRYVLLLNPDTLVHKNAFERMIGFLDSNQKIAAIGPAIVNADGSPQYTGIRFPNNWNIFSESLYLDRIFPHSRLFASHKSLFEDYTKPFSVDYVQGSCLLLRRSVLDTIGLLDESYFMYFEETDLCYRIKKSGYQIYYYSDAAITHFGGGEEGHFTEGRLLHYHKSLLFFYKKYYSISSGIILRCIIFIRSAIRILSWFGIYLVKAKLRKNASSIIMGYFKSFKLVVSI